MTRKNKRAAMELSIGTIVIVVLAMSMLILGLILIKNIFSGVSYNVDEVNNKVKDQIGKMFTDETKVVTYLQSDGIAKVTQGDDYGLAFGVRNNIQTQDFKWEVKLDDADVTQHCGVTAAQAQAWVITGRTGTLPISSGQFEAGLARFLIPEGQVKDISTCIVRFRLDVKKQDGTNYGISLFDVKAK